jgi:hypothetical protein
VCATQSAVEGLEWRIKELGAEKLTLFNHNVALEAQLDKVCLWSEDDPDWGTWNADCGMVWMLDEGSPEDNGMVYCPKCGGKLQQALTDESCIMPET